MADLEGALHFATPDADGRVRFVLDNGWTGTNARAIPVKLHDMRPYVDRLSLDADGFLLDRVASDVTDYSNSEQLEQLWKPAVLDMVLRVTGGARGVLFAGPNVRFSEADVRATSTSVSAPARAVHSDLAHSFCYNQMDRQPHAEEGMRDLRKVIGDAEPRRWRIFNIWQMISPPPQDSSLALCRLSSLKSEDYIHGCGYFDQPDMPREAILAGGDWNFDLAFYRHNEAQKWCYFSDMQPGEALVFSAFDQTAGSTQAKVAHASFDFPAVAATKSRSSIEIRALVVYN